MIKNIKKIYNFENNTLIAPLEIRNKVIQIILSFE